MHMRSKKNRSNTIFWAPCKAPKQSSWKLLSEGLQVRLHGLRDAELSNRLATFRKVLSSGRCEVSVDNRRLSVKSANLSPIFLYVLIDSNVSSMDQANFLVMALRSLAEQEIHAYRVLLSWHCDPHVVDLASGTAMRAGLLGLFENQMKVT